VFEKNWIFFSGVIFKKGSSSKKLRESRLSSQVLNLDCGSLHAVSDHLTKHGLKQFLGAKSTSILDCVGLPVGPLVRPSPTMRDYVENLVTSRLLREEEEEEETDYIAIPLRRDSFAPRD
jgi:hypothetical protein